MVNMKVSVVIATLGDIGLKRTITKINKGSIIPSEILICIPKEYEVKEDLKSISNTRIIYTEEKGQVFQRSVGFRNIKNELVLQLDDDVILDFQTLENLIHILKKLGRKAAVAPDFYWQGTKTLTYQRKNSGLLRSLMDWIANGKEGWKPGIISLSGIPFGPIYYDEKIEYHQTEWLSGGCILHYSDNLIKYNYFPFTGKAYAEDLIHSRLLRDNKVKLFVCHNARTWIDYEPYSSSIGDFYKQYKATKYSTLMYDRSITRLNLYFLIKFLLLQLKRFL